MLPPDAPSRLATARSLLQVMQVDTDRSNYERECLAAAYARLMRDPPDQAGARAAALDGAQHAFRGTFNENADERPEIWAVMAVYYLLS